MNKLILNNEQELLVNEHDKNILLLASAGTGKTDTLSRRVAKIISECKAKSSEILCITFTNKACKEMKERVEAIVGKDSKDITIKTVTRIINIITLAANNIVNKLVNSLLLIF